LKSSTLQGFISFIQPSAFVGTSLPSSFFADPFHLPLHLRLGKPKIGSLPGAIQNPPTPLLFTNSFTRPYASRKAQTLEKRAQDTFFTGDILMPLLLQGKGMFRQLYPPFPDPFPVTSTPVYGTGYCTDTLPIHPLLFSADA